ncbi:MAG TPA: hypothetical protein VLB44_14985 [Kofleriaceae bacterium]|nr:hypothetical protein [Kofleriaceae bacterium]
MGRRWVVAAALLLPAGACKAELGDGPADAARSSDGPQMNVNVDAAPDGTTPLGPWSTPAKIPGGDSTVDEDDCTLSSNELELYFKRNDGGDNNLYVMTRTSVTGAWSTPAAITILNSTAGEESPRLSPDNLTMYFGRAGDIYKTTRTAVGQPWTAPSAVAVLNTANVTEKWAAVCSNGYVIVSRANGTNGQDLYEGTITAGAPTNLTQLDTTSAEQGTLLTADCLGLYFQSNRTNAQFDIYLATRTSLTAQWSNPTALTDFNTPTYNEEDPWIAPTGRTFVFASNASGNKDLYISTR